MKPAGLICSGSKRVSKVVVENPHGLLIEVNGSGVINYKFMNRFAHCIVVQLQRHDLQHATTRVTMDSASAHISKKVLSYHWSLAASGCHSWRSHPICKAVDTDVACVLKAECSV